MKKLLVILAVFWIVLNSDIKVVNDIKEGVTDTVVNMVLDVNQPVSNAGARRVFRELSKHFSSYSSSEKTYLEELSGSNERTRQFYQNYCQNNDFNPIIYGEHLTQVCRVIRLNLDRLR